MGLIIDNLPILSGLVILDKVYVNVRDIRTSKEETNYIVEFLCYFSKEGKHIKTELLSKIGFYEENSWTVAYSILKEHLTGKSLTYVDA